MPRCARRTRRASWAPRLKTIPSVGPVIASALRARVTDAALFKNGRHLSAWIGIVPENDSTGGKVKQKGLSKKGDRYLRLLLVNGAMAIVRQAQKRPDKHPWVTKLLGRMSAKQVAIAIANKTARIAWAIMVHGGAAGRVILVPTAAAVCGYSLRCNKCVSSPRLFATGNDSLRPSDLCSYSQTRR